MKNIYKYLPIIFIFLHIIILTIIVSLYKKLKYHSIFKKKFLYLIYAISIPSSFFSIWGFLGLVGVISIEKNIYNSLPIGVLFLIPFIPLFYKSLIKLANNYSTNSIVDFIVKIYDNDYSLRAILSLTITFIAIPYISLQILGLEKILMISGINKFRYEILFFLIFFILIFIYIFKEYETPVAVAYQGIIFIISLLIIFIIISFFKFSSPIQILKQFFYKFSLKPEMANNVSSLIEYQKWFVRSIIYMLIFILLPRQFLIITSTDSSDLHKKESYVMSIILIFICAVSFFIPFIAYAGLVYGFPENQGELYIFKFALMGNNFINNLLLIFCVIGGISAIFSTLTREIIAINQILMDFVLNTLYKKQKNIQLNPKIIELINIIFGFIIINLSFIFIFITKAFYLQEFGNLSILSIIQLTPAFASIFIFKKKVNSKSIMYGFLSGVITVFAYYFIIKYRLISKGYSQLYIFEYLNGKFYFMAIISIFINLIIFFIYGITNRTEEKKDIGFELKDEFEKSVFQIYDELNLNSLKIKIIKILRMNPFKPFEIKFIEKHLDFEYTPDHLLKSIKELINYKILNKYKKGLVEYYNYNFSNPHDNEIEKFLKIYNLIEPIFLEFKENIRLSNYILNKFNMGIMIIEKNFIIKFINNYAINFIKKHNQNIPFNGQEIFNFVKNLNKDIFDSFKNGLKLAENGKKYTSEIKFFSNQNLNYLKLEIIPYFNLEEKVDHYIILFTDITESKIKFLNFGNIIGLYKTIFYNLPFGLIVFDEKGTLVLWNKFIEDFSGMGSYELKEINYKYIAKKLFNQNKFPGFYYFLSKREKYFVEDYFKLNFNIIFNSYHKMIIEYDVSINSKIYFFREICEQIIINNKKYYISVFVNIEKEKSLELKYLETVDFINKKIDYLVNIKKYSKYLDFVLNEDIEKVLELSREHINFDGVIVYLKNILNQKFNLNFLISYKNNYKIEKFVIKDEIKEKLFKYFDNNEFLILPDEKFNNEFNLWSREILNKELYNPEIYNLILVKVHTTENIKGFFGYIVEKKEKPYPVKLEMFSYEIMSNVLSYIILLNLYKSLEKKLLESQKLGSIGELTSGFIHDINNLLSGANGIVEIIKLLIKEKEDKTLEDKEKLIDEIMENILMMEDLLDESGEITKQLLVFSKQRELNFRYIDLIKILEKSINFIQKTSSENIKFKKYYSKDKKIILWADDTSLHQVFVNIFLNAVQAIKEIRNNGTIKVGINKVYIKERDDRFFGYIKSGNYWRITFVDNGIGMSNDVLKNIFKPFYTTKEEKGSGLGLFIVQKIIKYHKGFIRIKSKLRKGTKIEIYLPEIIKQNLRKDLNKKIKMCLNPEIINIGYFGKGKIFDRITIKLLKSNGFNVDDIKNFEKLRIYKEKHKYSILILNAESINFNDNKQIEFVYQYRNSLIFVLDEYKTIEKITNLNFEIPYLIQKPFNPKILINMIVEIAEKLDINR